MPTKPPQHRLHKPTYQRRNRRVVEIHGSERWRQFSKRMLKLHPLCMAPFCDRWRTGRAEIATQVHHIVSIADSQDLAFSDENCCPICTTCHAKVEQLHRAGRDTALMFRGWG